MRLDCPFCGSRDAHEFAYHGDGGLVRPETAEAMQAYVYERVNPAGAHCELWYHAGGCRSWLVVVRDTRSHVVGEVRMAEGGT